MKPKAFGMSSDAEDDLFSTDEEGEPFCVELLAVLVCASCLQSTLCKVFPIRGRTV